MSQANNSSTFRTAACVICTLTPHQAVQLPQVCHRPETGQSPLARTCGVTWTFLKRPHVQAHRLLCFRLFTSETSVKKIGGNLPYEMGLGTCFFRNACFTPRRAQDGFLGQMMQKLKQKHRDMCVHWSEAEYITLHI